MYILFFLLWIIFNGQITVEIVLFGLAISGAVYAFCCKFLDYSPRKDWVFITRMGYLLWYFGILVAEIVKANVATLRITLSPHSHVNPVIVRFKTVLKTRTAKVLLANSITLTPGTITVSLENDEYTVHCLDEKFSEGLEDSVFVKILQKMEGSAQSMVTAGDKKQADKNRR